MLKSPDQLFKKYLAGNVTQIEDFNFKPFDQFLTTYGKESSDIKLNIEYDEMAIKADLKEDVENKAGLMNVSLEVEDNSDSVNIYSCEDKFGIQTDVINDKYLVIENRDLKKLAKLFGLDDETIEKIPDSIPNDLMNNEEENDKIWQLEEKYAKRFIEQIDKEKYSAEKGIETDVNGNSIKTNKYMLTLTDKELGQILYSTIKELIDDPDFIELVEDTQKVYDYSWDDYKESLTSFEEEISKMDEKEWVLSIYESKGKVVKTEINYDDYIISLTISNNENVSEMIFSVTSKEDDTSNSISISNNYSNGKGEFTFSIIADGEESKLSLTSVENNGTVTTKVGLNSEEVDDSLNISFSFNFDSNNSVKDLDKNDMIVINDFTDEDLEKLITEIIDNINSDEGDSLIAGYLKMLLPTNNNSLDNNNSLYNNNNNNNFNRSEDPYSIFGTSEIDIEEEKKKVNDAIEYAMKSVLEEYNIRKRINEDADPAEFLTEEKIASYCDDMDIKIVDGSTIRVKYGNNVYYSKIYINPDEWALEAVETSYSEDGENY